MNTKKQIGAKITLVVLFLFLSAFVSAVVSNVLVSAINGDLHNAFSYQAFIKSIVSDGRHRFMFLILTFLLTIALITMVFFKISAKHEKTGMITVTPDIKIPAPAGQGQYGSARFSTQEEQKRQYTEIKIDSTHPVIRQLIEEGKKDHDATVKWELGETKTITISTPLNITSGIPVGYKRLPSGTELVKIIAGDVHIVCYGATRSGKTRTLVLQSICIMALACVDMLNCDPKGELYQYTYPFLKRLGYSLFAIDFKNPKRSMRYNFLQFIIDAVEQDDIPKAISCAWDFVDSIVKESKNQDPLWANGEKGLIAAAVIMLVYDNSTKGLKEQFPDMSDEDVIKLYEEKHKGYQNCINLFNFISKLSVINEATKNLLLTDVIENLSEQHPAKLTLAIAESAPPKTRGSFITSALATLRLFTSPDIADMTSSTDMDIFDKNKKKAIFIILPDARQTYYPIASMFVNQYYQYLADTADDRGGRLERDFEFNLDEFGNFTKIPFFDGKMTVGAGRGIHIHMYLQSREQLAEKYGKELANIILDNCHYLIYLKANAEETLKMIETKLDKYTVLSTSASSSQNSKGIFDTSSLSGSVSHSTQLVARSLLTKNEIEMINRPYLLSIADGLPSVMESPDLHKWIFNTMLGMGDKHHNIKLRELREKSRPEHMIEPYALWNFMEKINMLIAKNQLLSSPEVSDNEIALDDEMLDEIRENFFD